MSLHPIDMLDLSVVAFSRLAHRRKLRQLVEHAGIEPLCLISADSRTSWTTCLFCSRNDPKPFDCF